MLSARATRRPRMWYISSGLSESVTSCRMSTIAARLRASSRACASALPTRMCASTRASSSRTRDGLGVETGGARARGRAAPLARLRERLADADVRLDARQQLADAERLGDEIGGAEAERPHRRVFGRHRGHHQDGEVAVALVLLEPFEQLQPVDLGHHDVEQQEGGLDLLEFREQPVAARADGDFVPVLLEDPGQRLDERFVVVSDQNAGSQSWASSSARSTLPPLTTSTVVLERGTAPESSAAVGAAPDGSTASRQVRHRNCTAARMLSSSTSTTPRIRARSRDSSSNGTAPTLSVMRPSAMLSVFGSLTTSCAASDLYSLGAPAGSTPQMTASLPAAASPAATRSS